LFTLLSKVQQREDGVPLGISCINLYCKNEEVSSEVLKGIERFMKLVQSHTLTAQTDLDSLTTIELTPKKNYDTNRLSRGGLQFLNSTCALFDETEMKEGKSEGEKLVFNMKGLASLIEEQTVRYNFQYHEQNFDCSCPVIIVSTGRSIFKNTTAVPVEAFRDPNPDVLNSLEEDLLNQFRYFFNQVSRRGKKDIPDETSKHVQEKFVEARQKETKDVKEKRKEQNEIGAKTLHSWLTYAQIKTSSEGLPQITPEIIDSVISLEEDRELRIQEILSGPK